MVRFRFIIVCLAVLIAVPQIAAASATPPSPVPAVLNLTDAENVALARSPALALARAAVGQAQSSADLALSAALPNLSGQASSTYSKGGFRGTSGTTQTTNGFTSNDASVNLRQLVFDGGHVRAQVLSARYSTDAARLLLTRQIQTVFFTVAQDYYTALQARHQLITANDSLKLAKTQYNLVEAQFRAGAASRADVLTAQLPVAQALLAVAQAANGEKSQIAVLLNSMGVPSDTAVSLVDDNSVGAAAPPAQDIMTIAQTMRPDLLAARALLNSAQQSVRAARLQRFPTIVGTANDGPTSISPSGGTYANSRSVGVSLSVPIFDGGAIRAQTEAALAQQDSAQANFDSAALGVSQTVEQAVLGLSTAQSGLSAATAELSQARTVLDVTNAQYKAGVTTLPLLLNAQVGLTKAETDYVVAVYAYKIAQQQLKFAEGTFGSP